jgi:hypothetical protein
MSPLLLVPGSLRTALTHLYLTVFLKLTAAASRTSTPTASPAAITCTTAAERLQWANSALATARTAHPDTNIPAAQRWRSQAAQRRP